METRELAVLSQIAEILSDKNKSPLIPSEGIWKKIFCGAELEDLFEEREPQFHINSAGFGSEKELSFDGRTYNGLYETLKELVYQPEKLILFLSGVANRMSIYRIIDSSSEDAIRKKYGKRKITSLDEILLSVSDESKNAILSEFASKDFCKLKRCMNAINLDLLYCDGELCVQSFTMRSHESMQNLDIISRWLYAHYKNVYESYVSAKKAFAEGESVSCIMHCRNIITGIFSSQKSEQKKWLDGLKKACHQDKYINNLEANQIIKIQYNQNSGVDKERYQYPRFKLLYRLYSFTCALGAHKNEGNMTISGVDHEETDIEDALLALRMTEDTLIWFYKKL